MKVSGLRVAEYHVLARGERLPPLRTPVQYLLAADGVWKRGRNAHLEATIPIEPFRKPLPGLQPLLTPAIQLRFPRLPVGWLQTVFEWSHRAALARQEILFQVVAEGRRLRLVMPPQHAGEMQVQYDKRAGHAILDLHSHHVMPARFSPTDDGDETGLQFYAVVGNLLEAPEIRLRLGVYGHHLELPARSLFEGLGPFREAYYAAGN